MLILNQLSYSPDFFSGEVNDEPSMTVPDQTLSMREIVDRYTRGLPIDAAIYDAYDDGDDFLPDPKTLDLAEREALAADYKAEIKRVSEASKRKSKAGKEALQASQPVNEKPTALDPPISSETLPFPDGE